jgi:hypothetical protein
MELMTDLDWLTEEVVDDRFNPEDAFEDSSDTLGDNIDFDSDTFEDIIIFDCIWGEDILATNEGANCGSEDLAKLYTLTDLDICGVAVVLTPSLSTPLIISYDNSFVGVADGAIPSFVLSHIFSISTFFNPNSFINPDGA